MIDSVSLEKNNVDYDTLLNNPKLQWYTASDDYGEVVKHYCHLTRNHYSTYGGLYLQLKKYKSNGNQLWKLTIKNSLHKFYHGNNWSDFSFNQLCESIKLLCKILKIEPEEIKVKSFEFGVNIGTPKSVVEIYSKYLMYRRKRFEDISWCSSGGKVNGVVCKNTEFWVKVYDKGKQYNKEIPLLRFEIAIKKMRVARATYELQIYTLEDFMNKETFMSFKKVLSIVYDDIKRLEFIDLNRLKDSKRKTVEKGLETDWQRLNDLSKDRFTKRWQTFNKLQEMARTENIHGQIKQLIIAKSEQLLKSSDKSEVYQDSPLLVSVPNVEVYQDSPFICSGNLSKLTLDQLESFKERKCVVCRSDISKKRKDAKTCSKKCRNKKSNRYNNPLRIVKKELKMPTLFSVIEYLDTKKLGA